MSEGGNLFDASKWESWGVVPEAGEKRVEGLEAIVAEFEDRHKLATVYIRAAVTRHDNQTDVRMLIEQAFPQASEAERNKVFKRISSAPFTGGLPKLWQTYPAAKGAARSRYNRDMEVVRFGLAVVDYFRDPNQLFPDLDQRRHSRGVILPPAVLFSYAFVVDKPQIEGISLSGVIVEARFMEMYWYGKVGSSMRFLKPSAGGYVHRDWDETALMALQRQKQAIDASVMTAVNLSRKRLTHPYRGGLAGV